MVSILIVEICDLGHPTTPTYSYVRKFSDVLGPFVKDIHPYLGKEGNFAWTDKCAVLNDICGQSEGRS